MFVIPKSYWQVLGTGKKGRGVFAVKKIKKGTLIGDYLGKLVRYEEIDEADYPYLMYFNDQRGIVADKNQVGVHLLNHSCDPNCSMQPTRKYMSFVATKNINPGEELTISYKYPPQDFCTNCSHECFCGSANCLGTMHTLKEEYERWQNLRSEP